MKNLIAHNFKILSIVFSLLFCSLSIRADDVSDAAAAAYKTLDELANKAASRPELLGQIEAIRSRIKGSVSDWERSKNLSSDFASLIATMKESTLDLIKTNIENNAKVIKALLDRN